ncbi:MAG: histidine phosphatase family protein [Gammaproteobacteria bacterium]|nr:histidine phosphatase family protein [Gammaproteobacteria bacterium]
MSRILMIVRHAKSSWDSGAPTDFERPLGPRGERDAPRMGEWMKAQKLKPDYVVSSPAARAVQTTMGVCGPLGVKKKRFHWDERIYGSDVESLLEVLSEVPGKYDRVMLVGHNPGLEELVAFLWGEGTQIPSDGKLMPTATLAQVELPKSWKKLREGSARQVTVTRPRDIV